MADLPVLLPRPPGAPVRGHVRRRGDRSPPDSPAQPGVQRAGPRPAGGGAVPAQAGAPGRDGAAPAHGGGEVAAPAGNGTRARGWILTGFRVSAGPQEEEKEPQDARAARAAEPVGDSDGEASPVRRRPRPDPAGGDSSRREEGVPVGPPAGQAAAADGEDGPQAARLFARGVNRLIDDAEDFAQKVAFYCWQVEKCPETGEFCCSFFLFAVCVLLNVSLFFSVAGRLHTHLYLRGHQPLSFTQLSAWFPGWHLEKRKGTEAQAIAYCTKEESRVWGPFEHGEKAQQGRRSDLESALAAIKGGQGIRAVIEDGGNYQVRSKPAGWPSLCCCPFELSVEPCFCPVHSF